MNLHTYTTYMKVIGHCCAMCMVEVSAFPCRQVWLRSSGIKSLSLTLRRPSSSLFQSRVWRRLSPQDGCEAQAQSPRTKLKIKVSSPEEMEETGAFFGADSENGDVVLLMGDLGTGKTCFARGFLRARVGDPTLAVTSPSYLLDNTYEVADEDVTLHHMDLYRLQGGADLGVLDIPDVLTKDICLIEWPDRLGAAKPDDRLDVTMTAVNEDERHVILTGHGDWWAGAVGDFQRSRQTGGGNASL